jgi:hypothetical protein
MLCRRHDLDHRHDSTAARIALAFNLRLNNWYLIADVMALNMVGTSRCDVGKVAPFLQVVKVNL